MALEPNVFHRQTVCHICTLHPPRSLHKSGPCLEKIISHGLSSSRPASCLRIGFHLLRVKKTTTLDLHWMSPLLNNISITFEELALTQQEEAQSVRFSMKPRPLVDVSIVVRHRTKSTFLATTPLTLINGQIFMEVCSIALRKLIVSTC